MPVNNNAIGILNHFLNFVYSWVPEFPYLSRISKYDMMMIAPKIAPLVLCHPITEAMFRYQACFFIELHVVVN